MPMTYIEYAKGVEDPVQRAVIELWPENIDFFGVIPYLTAPGGSYRILQEGALASNTAFRAINEVPTEGAGLLLERVETVYPLAGNLDVDRVMIRRQGEGARTIRMNMQMKQKAKLWADTFMFGNNATAPREFTGLRNRLLSIAGSTDGTNYRSRIIANSAASGGGPLSLAQLDRAIGLVEKPNAIIMPKALMDRFAAAQRDTSIGGFVALDKDEMGRQITMYRGLPLYTGYGISNFGEFLPFNEVAVGGGSAVTASIYIVRFAEDGVVGLETAPMEVTDMGLLENGVHHRINIEHDTGMAVLDPFSALRFSSITKAAIVK